MTSRSIPSQAFRLVGCVGVLLFATSCANDAGNPMQPSAQTLYTTPTGLVTANPPQIFIGAGDIAGCGTNNDELTAQIIDTIPGKVFALGDNVYDNGTTTEFNNCYAPTWGRFKNRTSPATGNHEYNTSGAGPYFAYFGAAAGEPGKGYYSYDLGAWHIIVLNSSIARNAGSPQDVWLQNDLATHSNVCTLAYWHHALYGSDKGSGTGGSSYASMRPYWDRLYPAGADVVLNGHRHFYERLAPMKADGTRDDATGIREFIVGSGGIGGGTITTNLWPTSETHNGDTRGVLKLYLYDDSYAWRFIPIVGKTYTDSGSTACHGAPGSAPPAPVSTVTVAPSTASLQVGGTQQFTATLKDADGNVLTGRTITWASDNTAAATVNGTGLATGVAPGTPTITATSEGKSGSAALTVTAATVSASLSTVTASPGSIVANGEVSTITVTAKNASGNPVSGVAVQLFATGSGNTLTQPAGVTNASGVATGSLSSTVAETKTVSATIAGTAITQTAPVIVTPSTGGGGAISQALLTAGNNASNLKVYTTAAIAPAPNALVMVAVLDQTSSTAPPAPTLSGGGMSAWSQVTTLTLDTQGAPRKRLTIFRALSATPGSGPLTITSSTAVSNCQWAVSQFTGVDPSGANGAGAIGQVGSTGGDGVSGLTVALLPFTSPDNVAYGVFATASLLTITPGAGFTGIGQQSSGESPQGSLFAEWKANSSAIGASWASSNAGAVGVEIKAAGGGAPTVSPSLSTVVAGPTSFTAGGSSTITVTVKDGSGTAMSGVAVTLSAPGMTVTQPSSATDGSGVTTGSVSSTVAGQKTVTASAGGVSLNQQPVVTVTAGAADASQSTVSANPTSITAATGSSTITVTVKDAFGNPVSGSTVTLAATGTGNTLTQPSTTGANGVTTGSLSSTDAEQKTVTAKAGSLDITQSALVTVTPPVPTVSPSLSTVVAGPTSFTAGGSSTITVTVKDGSGTAMSGVAVTLSAPGMTVTQPGSTTDGSGVTTGSVSSTVAGQKTVTASAGGVSLNQQPVVTVTAGPADANRSTVSANPTSITAGSGTSTITVTVKDAFGNPVSGSTVTLAATGTGNTLTPPASPTDLAGVATGSLSSTDAEQKTVTAKAGVLDIVQSALVTVNPPGSAATITQSTLTSGNNTTNQKVYTTASIAPAANTLVLVAVLDHQSAAAAAAPTLSGGGMSAWDQVATLTFDTQGTPLKRMTIFRAMSASPGSGQITITSPTTVSNCQWIVSQFAGVDQSGVNGAGAIVQSGSARGDAVSSLSIPLAVFGNANNAAFGVFGVASKTPVVTPGGGFTEIAEQGSAESPLADLMAEWATNLNSVGASWASLNAGGLAVELKAKVGP